MIRRFGLAIFAFLISLSVSFAAGFGSAKEDGGKAGLLFDSAASPRSLAMGRTNLAVADDASAAFWNPAGLSQLERKDLVTMYSLLEEDTGFGFLSFAQPTLDWGTFGVSLVNLRSTNFKQTDINGNETGSFDQDETGLLFSHGFKANNRFSFGSSVRVVRQKIFTRDDVGVGLDLATMVGLHRTLNFGFAVNNLIAPKLRLEQQADEYPREIRMGLAFKPTKNWTWAADLNQSENQSAKLHFGAERSIKNLLALRVGVNETEITTGLGIDIGDWSLGYSFGYHNAISGADDLGGNHRFGFRLKMGSNVQEEKFSLRQQKRGRKVLNALARQMDTSMNNRDPKELTELVQEASVVVQKGGFIKPADLYEARGYIYYFRGDYEKAVQAFGEALELDSDNQSRVKRHHVKSLAQMSEERTREIVAFETNRVRTFYDSGQYKEAADSAKRILSFQPDNTIARGYLMDAQKRINEPIERELRIAKKLYEDEDYLRAMTHLLKIKEMDPTNKEAARYMSHAMGALKKQANLQYKVNNPTKKEVYEIGYDPKKSQELYSRGLLYYSQGKLQDALLFWERSVKLDNSNSMARNAYNRALQEIEENN